jgi:hypothetical protein
VAYKTAEGKGLAVFEPFENMSITPRQNDQVASPKADLLAAFSCEKCASLSNEVEISALGTFHLHTPITLEKTLRNDDPFSGEVVEPMIGIHAGLLRGRFVTERGLFDIDLLSQGV